MSDSVLFLLLALALMVIGGGAVYLHGRGPRRKRQSNHTDDLRRSLDALSTTRNRDQRR